MLSGIRLTTAALLFAGLPGITGIASADNRAVYGPRLEGFDYPHPVHTHAFESQRRQVEIPFEAGEAFDQRLGRPRRVLRDGHNGPRGCAPDGCCPPPFS